jgi:type VI protein secretion system component VasF
MVARPSGSKKTISLSDVEDSIRQLQGGAQRASDAASSAMPPLAVVVGGIAIGIVFLLGYRSGHRRSMTVEVKRL